MKQQSLFRGFARAVVLSLGCIPVAWTAKIFLPPPLALNVSVAVVALAAVIDILRVSGGGAGKTAVAFFAITALGCGVFLSPDQLILLAAALVWLTRSVVSYSSIIPSGLDAGLTAVSLGAAAWTVGNGSSFAMGVWVFFLIQSLAARIPRTMTCDAAEPAVSRDPFDQAYSSAEYALRRIIAR